MPENPRAIAVIMDGNRRWARERGLPTLKGHEAGLEKVRELVTWAQAADVSQITVYMFSTENWNRSEEEVGYLMTLFRRFINEGMKELASTDVRIRFMGEWERFAEDIQEAMTRIEKETMDGTVTLALALSYGGRSEILAGVNQLLKDGKREVSEEEFSDALWSRGLLDPDIVIRTGGDQRLSNFLPWQTVYSELFFIDTKWPDFSEEEFLSILDAYRARERRRGK